MISSVVNIPSLSQQPDFMQRISGNEGLEFQEMEWVHFLAARKAVEFGSLSAGDGATTRFPVYDPQLSEKAAAAGCRSLQACIDLTLAAEDCVTILGLAAGIPTLVAMVLLVVVIVVCARKRRKDGHTQEKQRPNDLPDLYDSSEVSLENLSSPDMDVKETIEMEETHVYVKTIMGTEELSYDAYFPRTGMEKKQSLPRWLLPKRGRK
ncbi:opalin [Petaurus breviceps papuanus]|uniref:opalin n=1 Tax=Petaurus breviceps papuanus TaxID=3040969 RepID=UPI0036DA86C1